MTGLDKKNNDKWTFKWTLSMPTQDPYLLIEFDNVTKALLFDCGVRVWGKVRTILKVEHLFISHAHIDHLIGFDHIVRSLLGENKTLNIHGPAGISDRLTAKLQGYDWDRSAEQELILNINEYKDDQIISRRYACNNQFKISGMPVIKQWNGPIVDEKKFSIWALPVVHGGSPCNAYVMREKDLIRIDKDGMEQLGLTPGPWVGKMLSVYENGGLENVKIDTGETGDVDGKLLIEKLIRTQKGRTVVYVTDTVYRDEWVAELARIAQGADLVACESTFLEEDSDLAEKYHHLTAVQAADLANIIKAKRLMLFHISSRYHPKIFRAVQEARRSFSNTDIVQQYGRKKNR